jgi:hypothetical protein
MMTKIIGKYLKIAILFISFNGFAQQNYKSQDLGGFLGVSYYLGDLNPLFHFKFSRPAIGGIYRVNMNRRFSFKSDLLVGFLKAEDKSGTSEWQENRNLSFISIIGEFAGQFEFNFFPYEAGSERYRYSPYVFAGFAFFFFNPTTLNNDSIPVFLQPLKTENKKYQLVQPSIPFGVGYKWNFRNKMTLALEWGVRKTFTDYIDDVSTVYVDPAPYMSNRRPEAQLLSYIFEPFQRGDSKHKDWYAFAGLSLTFTISSKTSCPVY